MSTNILRFTYDRDVTSKSGTIKIYDNTNTLLKTVNSTDPYVTYSPRKVEADIADLGITWQKATTYVITVDAGFMEEVGNNRSPSPLQTINYVTPGDPFIESTVPANLAENVTSFSLQLTFDEEVIATTGNFYIYESPSNTLKHTIPVTDNRVSISAKTVTINLDQLLALGTTYYIRADVDSLKNGFDFLFQGIDDDSVLKFTVKDIIYNYTLTNPNTNIQFFGGQVAVSNTRIAVASYGDDNSVLPNTVNGVIHLYDTQANLITSIADLNPKNAAWDFPRRMIMNDQYLVFVAQENWNIIKVHIHNPVTGALIRTISLPSPLISGVTNYYQLSSIDMDGDRLVVSEFSRQSGTLNTDPNDRTFMYVYSISTGALLKTYGFNSSNERGRTIRHKISGDKIIVAITEYAISLNPTVYSSKTYILDINSDLILREIPLEDTRGVTDVEINSLYYITKTRNEIKIYDAFTNNPLVLPNPIPLLRTITQGAPYINGNIKLSGELLLCQTYIFNIETGALFKDIAGTYGGTPITSAIIIYDFFGDKIAFGITTGEFGERVLVFTNPIP